MEQITAEQVTLTASSYHPLTRTLMVQHTLKFKTMRYEVLKLNHAVKLIATLKHACTHTWALHTTTPVHIII